MDFRVPSFGLLFSFCIYVSSLVYAIFKAYQYGNEIDKSNSDSSFTDGWLILNRRRDADDDEWESFVEHTKFYFYWYVCHVLLSEIVRLIDPCKLYFVHATVGVLFVLYNFNVYIWGIMFLMMFTYYYAMVFTKKRYVWALTILWLIIMNMAKQHTWENWLLKKFTSIEIEDTRITMSWLMLRLISFSVNYCNAKKNVDMTFIKQINERFAPIKFVAYSFYLPVFLHGPPLIYDRYASMFEKNQIQPVEESLQRLKELVIMLIRLGIVYLLNEFAMHLIYSNVVIYEPDLMKDMNLWTMYGFAYCMGQFFCNKYIVLYGLGIALARFDRIDAPKLPMCIGRIHLYSHMWRYFDRGLHDFLFKHIYEELCARTSPLSRKVFACSVSFIFIYLWHGYHLHLFVWVFLNFAFLYMELLGMQFSRSERYIQLIQPLGSKNVQRINAFFGSQLLIPSIITNLMFIGGPLVGEWLTIRTYFTGGFLNYFLLSFVAYHFYQVSSFIFDCEKQSI